MVPLKAWRSTGLEGGHAGSSYGSTWNVLVTGAAGFIGFHVAGALASAMHNVVGVDNFNHYYDVRLKYVSKPSFTSACTLIFGVRHSDVLEVGTKIEMHNDGLLGEGETERFYQNYR